MVHVTVDTLRSRICGLLQRSGLTAENAERVSEVYTRASLRGVGHHDIYDLPERLRLLADGKVNPNPDIRLQHKFGALESYDGDNGLGELCSWHIMERAMRLADEYGIGFAVIRRSNHFLAASPYVEYAADKGYLGIIFTRTKPAMSAPGGNRNVIGNNPMGFAFGTNRPFPLMLDIAMAYTSFGKLNEKIQKGETIPDHWGKDRNGRPTSLPSEVRDGGTINPMAEHKGFGLALLIETLTGVLSGGTVIDEGNPADGGYGVHSQAALAIRIDGLMPMEKFLERTSDMMERIMNLGGPIHFPGQQSWDNKNRIYRDGLWIPEPLLQLLNGWSDRLGVARWG